MKTRRQERGSLTFWFRLLGVGVPGGLLAGIIGYVAMAVQAMTAPAPSPVCCVTPANLGLEYEEIMFAAQDGVTLSGWLIPSGNTAGVLALHGYGGSRMEMLHRAGMLARHGYGVLLYDLRAHGKSGGDLRSWGWQDAQDVPAALALLQDRPEVNPSRIGILGFSIGGQIAIRAAAEWPALKAVIADGTGMATSRDYPPPLTPWERWITFPGGRLMDWGLALRLGEPVPKGVRETIEQLSPRPLLLIAGIRNREEQRTAASYFAAAGEPKALWEIAEAGHGGGPTARPQEYEERIVEFFDQALFGEH